MTTPHFSQTRRSFLLTGAAALAAAGLPIRAEEDRALVLHRETGVFEGYTKPSLKFTKARIEPGQFVERVEKQQAGMWRLRDGYVRMANMSVGVPRYHTAVSTEGNQPTSMPICSVEQQTRIVLRQLDALAQAANEHAHEMGLARTVTEATRMNAEGKLALFQHLTGAWISDDLAVMRTYQRVGVVAIHPCIEGHHAIGDAANEIRIHGGLSELGREVVREMNRLGMVVDVAHGSGESITQMVELSSAPVIYSHGGCRALCDVPRNMTDDHIRAIAAKGGVVGIAFVSAMLSDEARQKGGRSDPRYKEEYARADRELMESSGDPYVYLERRSDGTFMKKIYERLGWPSGGLVGEAVNRADLERVVDHIVHVVKIAGPDHVGIGTDYESGDVPNGLEHAGKLPNLTAALLKRGFSEGDVRKILMGNFQRVYLQVLGA